MQDPDNTFSDILPSKVKTPGEPGFSYKRGVSTPGELNELLQKVYYFKN